MKFLDKKLTSKFISRHKGKISSKIRALRERHKSAMNYKNNKNEAIRLENNTFYVMSETISGKGYEVTYQKKCSYNNQCELQCEKCNVCIHEYVCTCIDISIKFNLCKHIHLVRQKIKNDR